ncbi:response regulator [Hydrogenovibrio kuenenii]|uniref:response regulator n=1 Tax=Hydrogenovibrio kuenenii TaxID=63658 RepID=UPI00046706BD|nr:response regulator transcription factor [Hydrogenovibrio kuenenii]
MARAKPTVLISEDHDLVRAGFKSILESDGTVSVIAEAKDGESTLALTEDKKPDLLLIDLSMPKLSGIAVVTQLKKRKNPVKIIVLTAAEAPNVWKEVLDLGVDGVALKSVSQSELVSGIELVLAGQVFVHSEIEPDLNSYLETLEQSKSIETDVKKPKKLSVREKQVIKLVAEGYKTKDVADMLDISDRTVSKHRENIMTKLGMSSSAELVNYASHIGLLKVKLDEIK